MILGLVIGTIVCGLFPLLFLPVFRRMEAERLKAARPEIITKLAQLEDHIRVVESDVRDLRETSVAD